MRDLGPLCTACIPFPAVTSSGLDDEGSAGEA